MERGMMEAISAVIEAVQQADATCHQARPIILLVTLHVKTLRLTLHVG